MGEYHQGVVSRGGVRDVMYIEVAGFVERSMRRRLYIEVEDIF